MLDSQGNKGAVPPKRRREIHRYEPKVVREVLRRLRSGELGYHLAKEYGIPARTIYGWNYRHTLAFGRKRNGKQVGKRKYIRHVPLGPKGGPLTKDQILGVIAQLARLL